MFIPIRYLSKKFDALRDSVLLVQFLKHEKHPWRSVTGRCVIFIRIAGFSNTPPWTFFTFFKICYWYQILQSASNIKKASETPSLIHFLKQENII